MKQGVDNILPEDGQLDPAEFMKILAAYDQATLELQKTHDSLRMQVENLSGQLGKKNEELTSSLEEVNALKNYLANILESITDGVIAIGPDRRIIAFNQSAAEAVLSISIDPMGQPIADVLPTACQELGKILDRVLTEQEGLTNIELILNGKTKRIFSVSASLIRNSRGEILGAVETFRDLTDIKLLEEKAERQDRLSELGEMAAGVAHEIRNPLGGIELYASTLKQRFESESKEAGIAQKIVDAAGALNRIVTDMLTFTRGREPILKKSIVELVCSTALDMAAREIDAKDIKISLRHALGKQKFLIDPDQIAQALLNVILNAVQFTPPGGEIVLSTYEVNTAESKEIFIEVEDGGEGIGEEALPKLFNPFFTTRKEGTGLGLAIVHKILQEHGGSVAVSNNSPRGACFTFRIPVITEIVGE